MARDDSLRLLDEIMGGLPVLRFSTRHAQTTEEYERWKEQGVIGQSSDLKQAILDALKLADMRGGDNSGTVEAETTPLPRKGTE